MFNFNMSLIKRDNCQQNDFFVNFDCSSIKCSIIKLVIKNLQNSVNIRWTMQYVPYPNNYFEILIKWSFDILLEVKLGWALRA